MIFKVYEITGEYAITADAGQKLYEQVHPCLLAAEPVMLDFTHVRIFASPFFNFAIGQLLRDIPRDDLNQLMEFSELSHNGQILLEHVIENAKHYYSDEEYRHAVDAVITEKASTL